MTIGDAVIAPRIECRGRAFKTLLRLDHRTRRKAIVAAPKAVVAIQFARQCDPIQRAVDIRSKLVSLVGSPADYPVIRGRVAPNLLFFSIVPGAEREQWLRALLDFELKCAKAEIIG